MENFCDKKEDRKLIREKKGENNTFLKTVKTTFVIIKMSGNTRPVFKNTSSASFEKYSLMFIIFNRNFIDRKDK